MKKTLIIAAVSITSLWPLPSAASVGHNVTLLVARPVPTTAPAATRPEGERRPFEFEQLKPTKPGRMVTQRQTEVWHPRGPRDADVIVTALAPPDVGFTNSAKPSLYFHLSQATAHPIIATLSRVGDPVPIKTWRLSGGSRGFYRLELDPNDAALEPGCEYEWVVAVRPDERHASKDVVAMGFISRAPAASGDAAAPSASNQNIYDAIRLALDDIEHRPEAYRAFLLDEIELVERETTPAAAVRTRSRS